MAGINPMGVYRSPSSRPIQVMVGSVDLPGAAPQRRWWQPLPLRVDPGDHRSEIDRFLRRIVAGPLVTDCWGWTGGLSDDGYGLSRQARWDDARGPDFTLRIGCRARR
jgi:hypothetical protein